MLRVWHIFMQHLAQELCSWEASEHVEEQTLVPWCIQSWQQLGDTTLFGAPPGSILR